MNNELVISILAGLGGMIGWGAADFLATKAMKEEHVNENQANLIMFTASSILLWIIVIGGNQPFAAITIGKLAQIAIFAIANVVAYLLFFKALHVGNLSTISPIFSTYGVGATLISILFFAEPTTPTRLFSLVIVFLGIVAVSIQDVSKLKIIKGFVPVTIGALIFALYFPFWDSFLSQQNASLFWLAIENSFIALFFYLFVLHTNKHKKAKTFPKNGYGLLALAATSTSIALVATTLGFELTTLTSVVTVVSSAIPLVTTVLGYLFLRERLIKTQYFGILAIVLGTTLLFLS